MCGESLFCFRERTDISEGSTPPSLRCITLLTGVKMTPDLQMTFLVEAKKKHSNLHLMSSHFASFPSFLAV